MKKLAILAAAAAATVSSPALADANLVYNLDADVGEICGVYKFDGPIVPVNFNDLSAVAEGTDVTVGAGSASYRCNAPAGFTRVISSANNGKLVRVGSNGDANNSLPFTFSHGGGSGLGTGGYVSLTSNLTNTFAGSPAFLAGQTGSVNFRTQGVRNNSSGNNNAPGTTVFAGDYVDVVTIAVTGN